MQEPTGERPDVDALINPKQPGCAYPFDGLAACGVAYKLLVALELRVFRGGLDPGASLDAVALGTIADVVPLTGENRIIAHYGLGNLKRSKLTGIQALIDSAGLNGQTLDSYHVGFLLAPRLNASNPRAPVPVYKSSTRAPATRSPKLEKIACFTLSGEGRISGPFGIAR